MHNPKTVKNEEIKVTVEELISKEEKGLKQGNSSVFLSSIFSCLESNVVKGFIIFILYPWG